MLKNKKIRTLFLTSAAALSIIAIIAVCWHSLEEIHYLKSFYPTWFTVEEAYYASTIELIKVFIIGFPLLIVLVISLSLLNRFRD